MEERLVRVEVLLPLCFLFFKMTHTAVDVSMCVFFPPPTPMSALSPSDAPLVNVQSLGNGIVYRMLGRDTQ